MTNLTAAITIRNNEEVFDVALVDGFKINQQLKKFKTDRGDINYTALFNIPVAERINQMAKKDLGGTIKIIAVALTMAFEKMNLVRKMTNAQVLDLAEEIVDSSEDGDRIALEDLMLFLQKLTRGEYSELYEGIDQVKFIARFDEYRDVRWEEAKRIAENKHQEYKNMGDPQRTGSAKTALDEHLSSFTTKIESLKDELREQKEINKRLKDDF